MWQLMRQTTYSITRRETWMHGKTHTWSPQTYTLAQLTAARNGTESDTVWNPDTSGRWHSQCGSEQIDQDRTWPKMGCVTLYKSRFLTELLPPSLHYVAYGHYDSPIDIRLLLKGICTWFPLTGLDSVVKFCLTWSQFTYSMALDAYHIDSVNTCYD